MSANHNRFFGRRGSCLLVLVLDSRSLLGERERWMALTKRKGRIIQGQHRQRHVASAPATPAPQAPDSSKTPRSPGRVLSLPKKPDEEATRLALPPDLLLPDVPAAAQMGQATRYSRERDPWQDTAAGLPGPGVRRWAGESAHSSATVRVSASLRNTMLRTPWTLRRQDSSRALRCRLH